MPKSKLSRRVAKLETRLGVSLIERSTRHFRVTEVGRAFYQCCGTLLEVAEEAEAVVAEARKGEPSGELRFGCPSDLVELVAPILSRFLSRYPKVRLQMIVLDRAADLVQEAVDLAIRVRTGFDGSTTLKMRSLGISRKILVASPYWAEAASGDICQLAQLPTLGTTEDLSEVEWTLIGPGDLTKNIRLKPRIKCTVSSVIRDAAAEGLGVALLPDHVCRDYLGQGKLVRIFPDWRSPDGIVHVVFSARRGLPTAVRALIDHLVAALPSEILSSQEARPDNVQSYRRQNDFTKFHPIGATDG